MKIAAVANQVRVTRPPHVRVTIGAPPCPVAVCGRSARASGVSCGMDGARMPVKPCVLGSSEHCGAFP